MFVTGRCKNGTPLSRVHTHLIKLVLLAGSIFTNQAIAAGRDGATITNNAVYAAGATIGSGGIGISFSSLTPWHMVPNDQLQWRLVASGFKSDDAEGDYSDIDYIDGDVSLFMLQGGVDWYPFQGWANPVFFSAGLMYSGLDLSAPADTSKTFSIGGRQVNPGDIRSLNIDVERKGVAHYVSLGWGNKITGRRGVNFQMELGLSVAFNDVDVEVVAVDPNSFLDASHLAAEEKEIKDDVDDISAFAMATVSYHF